MAQEPDLGSLKKCFGKVKDPRIDRPKWHKLIDILIIIEQESDYILAVKENQGHLHEDIHDLF